MSHIRRDGPFPIPVMSCSSALPTPFGGFGIRNKSMAETISRAVEYIKKTVLLTSLDQSATKQSVVLRLLSLCGKDPFDPSQVVPEYTVGTRRVDLALQPGSAHAVFIEVKHPCENVGNHQRQLLEYCFQEGVKLAALTNGRTWWLYLPLQSGSWEQRRFLTIDLESQEPDIVEQRFLDYLSREKVISGRAVSDAEDLVRSQQRADVATKTIVQAWKQIVEAPDEYLVDLISETAERICGFKPEPELVEQFLLQRVRALNDAPSERTLPVHSRETNIPPARRTRREGRAPPCRSLWIRRTPLNSWPLCYAPRKPGLKFCTAMAAKSFADGTPPS